MAHLILARSFRAMSYSHPLYESAEEEAAVREADHKKFKAEFDKFWSKDDDVLGLILKCHLIVEVFMTECLRVAFSGIDNFEDARLSFSQKHHLLTGWTFGFPWIKDGVRALNSLRNKVAHNIDYEIREEDLAKIYSCMDAFSHAQRAQPKRGQQAIVAFTELAAMALSSWTEEIRRHAPETGAMGYNELCKMRYKEKAKI
jgi:hypothetical protein